DLLERRWLTNDGPYVREFERKVADLAGVEHAVAVCNATAALELTVRALGWHGEVLLPSFTFIATAHALRWQGITPVFCDVDPRTHNLDPKEVERAVTPRTTGIIGVHVWGRPCEVEALEEIAQRRGLGLIFDAAHALGCSAGGRSIGGFGQAEIFSFHATKIVNSSEGGVIVTRSPDLAEKLRRMRNFGFLGEDVVDGLGTNAKMPEVCAVMGLGSLETLDEWVAVNLRNYQNYQAELHGLKGIELVPYDLSEKNNYQYVVVEIEGPPDGRTRDRIRDVLRAENVVARRYFHPGCHRLEPYVSEASTTGRPLPETERLAARVLALPTGTAVGEAEIHSIADILRVCAENAESLAAARLPQPATA
ncbi:MAG TPA: aminotransferase class I/II-fold pyridoxal phosphate-dependent enzyme, partial [Anaerolineales bacterium]|nr:aminotransferase class I/II-fold pyridoxal phosphate-dependent enzyme [Anaerolineales bacterium]